MISLAVKVTQWNISHTTLGLCIIQSYWGGLHGWHYQLNWSIQQCLSSIEAHIVNKTPALWMLGGGSVPSIVVCPITSGNTRTTQKHFQCSMFSSNCSYLHSSTNWRLFQALNIGMLEEGLVTFHENWVLSTILTKFCIITACHQHPGTQQDGQAHRHTQLQLFHLCM